MPSEDANACVDTPSFEARVNAVLADLTPVEQRMARFFIDHKETVVLGSAAQVAAQAGTSDATVVRTARSLGFAGLAELRAALLVEISASPSPGRRLLRTLDEAGTDSVHILSHVVSLHEKGLAALQREDLGRQFAHAIDILAAAEKRHVFGIGPSGVLASYAALQFNRIGQPTATLTESGVGLADQLLGLGKGDAVMMFAYAPLYREVTVVLDAARDRSLPVVLVTDSLGPLVADRVAGVLPLPRGRTDHLAMHAGTMVLVEAMIIALAARRRDDALASLERLNELRGSIDKDWIKRGIRRSRR